MEGLEIMKGIAAWLEQNRSDSPGFPYWMLTVRQGMLSTEAMLRWCDEAEGVIEGLRD